jgi:hypothetical protein
VHPKKFKIEFGSDYHLSILVLATSEFFSARLRSSARKWGSIAAGARSPFWVLERTLNVKTLADDLLLSESSFQYT